jgi:hypothetical protein
MGVAADPRVDQRHAAVSEAIAVQAELVHFGCSEADEYEVAALFGEVAAGWRIPCQHLATGGSQVLFAPRGDLSLLCRDCAGQRLQDRSIWMCSDCQLPVPWRADLHVGRTSQLVVISARCGACRGETAWR